MSAAVQSGGHDDRNRDEVLTVAEITGDGTSARDSSLNLLEHERTSERIGDGKGCTPLFHGESRRSTRVPGISLQRQP